VRAGKNEKGKIQGKEASIGEKGDFEGGRPNGKDPKKGRR